MVFDIVVVCLGEELDVLIMNLDLNDILIYSWLFLDVIVSGVDLVLFDVIEIIGV